MRRLLHVTTLIALAAILVPATASAAPATASAAPATATVDPATLPLVSAPVSVQYWLAADPGKAISIVSIEVPESVKLPARVRLPIVDGSTVEWAGEIADTTVDQDIQRDFTVGKASGGSYAEIVLEKYRVAQIDLSLVPMTLADERWSVSFSFTQSVDATSTEFSVRLPATAADVKIEPKVLGKPAVNEAGEQLYTLPALTLAKGESSALTASYADQTLVDPAQAQNQKFTTLIWVLVGLVAVVLVSLIVVVRRGR